MDILAHIIEYGIFAVLILAGLGFIVRICQYFYYREYRSGIVAEMETFEQLKREQEWKGKRHLDLSQVPDIQKEPVNPVSDITPRPKKSRPMWLKILRMTPAEYIEYRKQSKEQNQSYENILI